jgi:hypothetical protein
MGRKPFAGSRDIHADGDGARTIWHLSKALNWVMKDTARAERRFDRAPRNIDSRAGSLDSVRREPVPGRIHAQLTC